MSPEKTIVKAGKIRCMPSPAMVQRVEAVTMLEMAQLSNKARIIERNQAAVEAIDAGGEAPNPTGSKRERVNNGTPLSIVGTIRCDRALAYHRKYKSSGRHSS